MSERGGNFAYDWVQENIHIEAYDPPQKLIDDTVRELLDDARAKGITQEEIEEEVGDLRDFVSETFEQRTDDEVARLAAKDD